MHITSNSDSPGKRTSVKTSTKPRARSKTTEKETLHLKSEQLQSVPANEELANMIATVAYYRAEQRGFEPGHELEDWLYAEHQVRAHP